MPWGEGQRVSPQGCVAAALGAASLPLLGGVGGGGSDSREGPRAPVGSTARGGQGRSRQFTAVLFYTQCPVMAEPQSPAPRPPGDHGHLVWQPQSRT